MPTLTALLERKNTMLLSDLSRDYLAFIKHERGLSHNTHKGYQSSLNHFLRWLDDNGYPAATLEAFTAPVLRRFLYGLAGRALRPRTIRGYFHSIRGMGEFLVLQNVIPSNPAKTLTLPKKDAAIRNTVSDGEIAQLLQTCDRQRNPRQIAFAKAIVSVFVYGGLRRQEALDLMTDDVDLKDGSILVRSGKGSKSRRVYVCNDCVEALREWLALRPTNCTHTYLFAFDPIRRIHFNGLHTLIEDIKAGAGLGQHDNIKPHSLRHACATRMMRNGADLRSIQAFLGHSSLAVTSIYLHTDEERLKEVAHLQSLRPPKSDTGVADKGRSVRRSLRR